MPFVIITDAAGINRLNCILALDKLRYDFLAEARAACLFAKKDRGAIWPVIDNPRHRKPVKYWAEEAFIKIAPLAYRIQMLHLGYANAASAAAPVPLPRRSYHRPKPQQKPMVHKFDGNILAIGLFGLLIIPPSHLLLLRL